MSKSAPNGPAVGSILALEIREMTVDGEGIGGYQEVDVHTYGCFPGETVEARVLARSRHHPRAHAKLVEITDPHRQRRPSPCVHHPMCCGCPLIELEAPAQRELKRLRAARQLGVEIGPLIHHRDQEFGYRHSSKRVVFGEPGKLWLGSYRRGSHRGAGMKTCLVDHPRIVEAAEQLAAAARLLRVVPYEEKTGEGDLRYVWLRTDGERVVVTLVTASSTSRAAELLPEALETISAIAWSVYPGKGNAARGREATVLRGDANLVLELGEDIQLSCGPLGFLQPNPGVAVMAYRDLVAGSAGERIAGSLAYDLYAGSGVTTALLRQQFREVVPCESYPESARALGVAPKKVADFLAEEHARPDLVVANPPRGGMGHRVCDALRALGAPRLHIMSCSAEALARDIEMLCRDGRYILQGVRAYDTLPQTPHLELVAWLRVDDSTSK